MPHIHEGLGDGPQAGIDASEALVPRPFRVRAKRRETHDTVTLDLEAATRTQPDREGGERLVFVPGQFHMLYVFGVGEVPISISGVSTTGGPSHTIRSVGAVTQALCALRRGDPVGVRGPFGKGWPIDDAPGRDVVLVAGGIGLAPLRPVLRRLVADREKFGKLVLLCGTRSPDDLLYRRELERWSGRLDLDVRVTVDHATRDWRGAVGVVTEEIRKTTFAAEEARVFLCGPEVMMRRAVQEFLRLGVSESAVFLSMERNMKCAVGFCGHCQFGPAFICRDGPVFRYDAIRSLFSLREV